MNTDHLTYQILGGHLRVRRLDGRDGITWDELQAAKNEALGEDVTCIEVYPAQDELVNETNTRHLWVVDAGDVPSLYRTVRYV